MWNTCNASCAHCAVNSGPKERAVLTDDEILRLIDGCFVNDISPYIGLSGGEAFLHVERLAKIVRYATSKGAQVSVNTNAFWATNSSKAIETVRQAKSWGLTKMVVSTDDFHAPYVPQDRIIHAIRACKKIHLEVDLQFVSTKRTSRLSDFLKTYQDDLLNISCREIPCHPVGRARREIAECDLLVEEGIPTGKCPSAVLSVSAKGDVIPCCNTAGHLPSLRIGSVGEPLDILHDKFRTSAVMQVLCECGPSALVEAAVKAGMSLRQDGYVDQCHLCYDIFRDDAIAAAAKDFAADRMTEKVLRSIGRSFSR